MKTLQEKLPEEITDRTVPKAWTEETFQAAVNRQECGKHPAAENRMAGLKTENALLTTVRHAEKIYAGEMSP